MKNFVRDADSVVVTAPYARLSGEGVLVGSLFGICEVDAASGARVAIKRSGVFTHAKTASQAWTDGQLIYWDNAARVFTNVSTSNKLVGIAIGAVAGGAGDILGTVLVTGAAAN